MRGEAVESDLWAVQGARVAPLPPEGTEWWIGGGVAKAIDRAARLGDCWYGNADLTPETAARDMALYREACARHGRTPVRIPIRKDVFIAEDSAEAERVGDALVAGGYRGFERGAVAYGDPESVAEQLSVFEELGFTDVIIRTMSPVPPELGRQCGGPLGRVGGGGALRVSPDPAFSRVATVPATRVEGALRPEQEVGALDVQRTTEVIALGEAATERPERLLLGRVLDSFADRLVAERVRQLHHGGGQAVGVVA